MKLIEQLRALLNVNMLGVSLKSKLNIGLDKKISYEFKSFSNPQKMFWIILGPIWLL